MTDTPLTQLNSPDPKVRSSAVLQLDGKNADDALPILLNVLCTDEDLNVIEDTTWVLVRYGTDATTALLSKIADDSPRVRHNIVHALGKLADDNTLPALISATNDTDQTVRLKATYALGQLGHHDAIDALIARLDDPVQEVRLTAHEVLRGYGQRAVPKFIGALKHESAFTRELSVNLLGDSGDATAVEPLITALDSDNWDVRFAIIEALGQIDDQRALPAVENALHDDDSRVRAIAKATLKMWGK